MVHAVYIFGTGSIEKYELDFFLSFCGLQIGLTPAETSYSTHTSPTIAPTLTLKSLSQPTKTLSTFSNCGPAQTVCYEYVPHSFFFNATVLEKVNAYKSTEKKKKHLHWGNTCIFPAPLVLAYGSSSLLRSSVLKKHYF